MPRIKIHTHDAPPCLPQWRNKDGWIAENAGSGYYRVEPEGNRPGRLLLLLGMS